MAFYDLRTYRIPDLNDIVKERVLFKIWVMNHAITSGRWQVIGNMALEAELRTPPNFFKEDPISGRLTIYNQNQERPATLDECDNLEAAAIWDPIHVEGRLRDHFAGLPNATHEWLKPGRQPSGRIRHH